MYLLIDELGYKYLVEEITLNIDEQYVCGNIEHIINLNNNTSAFIDYPNIGWEEIRLGYH